jgi:serine/threonine protein kinase
MVNEQIGAYRIVRSLGRGSYGSVWAAEAEDGSQVAMKILNSQVLENEKVVRKFFHEAMILAKLDHPNICKLLDFFPDGDNYAIVMEYVDGVELKKLLAQHQGPLPFDQAYKLARQTLKAFQYAHENGILHRDIKPGNIMIDQNGDARIMDFGIASMSKIASQDTAASQLSVSYVPPERLDRHMQIDARSDIYSLALVFYEMFTGRRAFDANDASALKACHRSEIPAPPETLTSNLPHKISQAISKALEKNPESRFQDFETFGQALEIDRQSGDDEPPLSSDADGEKEIKGFPVWAIVVAALLVIGGSIGAYIILTSTAP